MDSEMSVAVVVSIATIVGALIAAATSYVSLTLNKEQKVAVPPNKSVNRTAGDLSDHPGTAGYIKR